MKRLGVVLLAIATQAHGDTTVGSSPKRAGWVGTCVSAFERARDEHAKVNSWFRDAQIKVVTTERPFREPGKCQARDSTEISLHLGDAAIYEATFSLKSGEDEHATQDRTRSESQPPMSEERGERRHDRGRSATVRMAKLDFSDGDEFVTTFKRALDQCAAAAPSSPLPPSPSSGLSDAQLAVWQLERICIVEGAAIGYGAQPGRTEPLLRRITSTGIAATPLLLELAHSSNPTARAVGAMGLGEIRSRSGRAALESLSTDVARTETINGCMGSSESVAAFAKRALERYR